MVQLKIIDPISPEENPIGKAVKILRDSNVLLFN